MKIDIFYNELDESTCFYVLSPIVFEIDGETFVVPVGFASDGGSIPRAFWRILTPLDGRYIEAYTIHDYLYSIHYDRKKADKHLRDSLIEKGMGKIEAYSVYYAVRAFGESHY